MTETIKGELEYKESSKGTIITGVDEVGRGCLAGPVYTAAVILDYEALDKLDDKTKGLIRDSKKLSHLQRKKIVPIIEEISVSYSITYCDAREIEKYGIVGATFESMKKSIKGLSEKAELVLIDGNAKIPNFETDQINLIGGDSICYNIAAASILAKEARDEMMKKAGEDYPGYGFERHVGYGTKVHMEALKELGVTPIHRRNFAPVAKLL